jgi:hypothetical protein
MFVNTPTALERAGDFCQSRNVSSGLITIKDPQTGQSFPGNVIPKTRINSLGLSILNYYPTPNYTDPDPRNAYRWNYRSVYSRNTPRRNDMVRTDWNASSTLQIYYRYGRDTDNTLSESSSGLRGSWRGVYILQSAGCGRFRHHFGQPVLLRAQPQLRPGLIRSQ